MDTCPKCFQTIQNNYCPACEEKERDYHRHDNQGAYEKSETYSSTPASNQQYFRPSASYGSGVSSGTPSGLDKIFKGFIYAKWTPFLLIVILAYKIFLSTRFLIYFSNSFASLAPFTPLAILVAIDLLLLLIFIKKHKSKNSDAGKPTSCGLLFIILLLWFWYLPFIAISISLRMV